MKTSLDERDRVRRKRRIGLGAVAAAAACWAAAASVARGLFVGGVNPIELVEARAVVATAGLALVPGAWRSSGGGRRAWFIAGALGVTIALVNATYYVTIDLLPVAVAIVLQYTAPVLVVLWVAAVDRRRPSKTLLIALVLALAGVALVAELPEGDIGGLQATGVAMGLTGALLFAAYTLLSERAAALFGPIGALARAFAVAAVLWVVFQVPRGVPEDLFDPANVPAVLFVGTVGTLIPFLLFLWGVRQIRASTAAVAATLEPVLAAVVAWVWLGEALTTMQIGGGVLVLMGVALLQLGGGEAIPATGDPAAVAPRNLAPDDRP